VIAWNRILRAGEAGSQQRLPPDRNDEYAFYQLLLGSWPPELSAQNLDPGRMEVFRLRLEGAMTKAMREAKVNTSWAAPNLVYEDAVLTFIRSALDTTRKNSFLASFLSFQESIATAGMGNSLIQSVLKFTLPGVPDIYQGAELWDFSFVDPDNRRPVDYDIRSEMLSDMRREAQRLSENYLSALATNWRDGQIKLFLAFELLKLRQRQPRIFQEGSYEPLAVSGAGADRICAFARNAQDETIVVAALLYPGRSSQEDIGATKLSTPPAIKARSWVELFSRRQIEVSDDSFAARELFALLPVAVLTPNNGSS
jgi:(1->4)-alpha-D-glucan 1-alpha-D-glucosylmutase